MQFLQSEDVRLPYDIFGEGSGHWVTVVNSFARPCSDYRALARYLSERGLRVLLFDPRGAGKAECPPSFTLEDMVDDIFRLWDHLGIPAAYLVGFGYGGVVAALTAANPKRAATGLVLVGTPRSHEDLAVETAPPPRDPRRFLANVARYFSKDFVKTNTPLVQGYARQVARTFQEPDSALGATCQRQALEGVDISPLLPTIRCPTLVLYGEEDQLVKPDSARWMAQTIPGATLEGFAGNGHLLLVEASLRLYERIQAFCLSGQK